MKILIHKWSRSNIQGIMVSAHGSSLPIYYELPKGVAVISLCKYIHYRYLSFYELEKRILQYDGDSLATLNLPKELCISVGGLDGYSKVPIVTLSDEYATSHMVGTITELPGHLPALEFIKEKNTKALELLTIASDNTDELKKKVRRYPTIIQSPEHLDPNIYMSKREVLKHFLLEDLINEQIKKYPNKFIIIFLLACNEIPSSEEYIRPYTLSIDNYIRQYEKKVIKDWYKTPVHTIETIEDIISR